MLENVRHTDEDRILSSLYGMTLAGLREMQKRRGNEPIKHLIARAIEIKEAQNNRDKAGGSARRRSFRARR